MLAARRLRKRNERDRARRFLIEGRLAVLDALDGGPVVEVFFDPEEADDVGRDAAEAGIDAVPVGRNVLHALADAATPQGVVAVVEMPELGLGHVLEGDLVMILDQVRDPGNAGTLVRSALGAGASGVVFTTGSVDPYNAKTLRAASGSVLRIPVVRDVSLEAAADRLSAGGFRLIGTDARAPDALDEADLTGPVGLVLGNEAWGLREEARAAVGATVRIPMPGPLESLNVGIAGSILLFEAVRQRRAAGAVYPDQP